MPLTMHSASVPIFSTLLGNLSKWIDKATLHATTKGFDPDTLMSVRLAPDMLSFGRQVQIACDAAKFGVSRLAGGQAPSFDDSEASLAQLKERIAATLAYLASVPPEALDGSEDRPVSVPIRGRDALQFNGAQYLQQFALPNFFFHVTTAYALLRHNGVELGKRDYLGGP
jgi:hypothetical protein